MAIRELKCASVKEFASIVSRDYENIEEELFDSDGSPKDWKDRPLIEQLVKDAGLTGLECAKPKPL